MTKKPIPLTLVFTLLLALTGWTTQAAAADKPNLLVMGEDGDKESVPRSSRVFQRVQDALIDQLNVAGFDVYDETAITLDDFKQGRSRRTDAELLDIARSVRRPPIDVVVVFSIYASGKALDHTTKIRTRIEGRILNAKSGKRLDSFEVTSPREWSAEPNCARECILEVVGDYSKILGKDLGAVLAEKLEYIVDSDGSGGESEVSTGYTMIFDGFSPEEMEDIEEYLMIFDGYRTHRPSYMGKTRSEIWYESSIRTSALTRNLNRTLKHLGYNTRVQFSGNTVTVQRITKRGEGKKRTNPDW